jgi:hypothetical protein
LIQTQKIAASEVQCLETGAGFQVLLESDEESMPLLTVSNDSSISQSCGGVASRLKTAIDSHSLNRLMLVADPDRGICIVRSAREGCRISNSNRLLDIPRGMDGDQFLSSILDISAESFFVGDAGQHTTRRYYVKLGQSLTELLNR